MVLVSLTPSATGWKTWGWRHRQAVAANDPAMRTATSPATVHLTSRAGRLVGGLGGIATVCVPMVRPFVELGAGHQGLCGLTPSVGPRGGGTNAR